MPKKRYARFDKIKKMWGDNTEQKNQKPRPPPGLRGKEIGLFYRNLNLQNKSNTRKDRSDDITVNLRIPTSLEKKVRDLLKTLEDTDHNVKPEPMDDQSGDGNGDQYHELWGSDYDCIEKPKKMNDEVLKMDFIPLGTRKKKDDQTDFKTPQPPKITKVMVEPEHLTPLRNWKLPAYKYEYEDIIKTTFEEKLIQDLANGRLNATTNPEIVQLNNEFIQQYFNRADSPIFQHFLKFRQTLPAFKKRRDILELVAENQVVVISGETGCGKSTQVPQLILDEAMKRGKGVNTKILVTQPRRIAASSLAQRVAQERNEVIGESVGYIVRLEGTPPRPRGSILFCTTGVLLVELELKQALTEYSHIILDEVHERDVHIDIAMMVLKKVLQERKDLKLILMSATLDATALSSYFNNAPKLHIEGLAYPVTDYYLEDILELINYRLPPEQFRGRGFRQAAAKQMEYQVEIGPWLCGKRSQLRPQVFEALKDHRIEELNMDLICDVLKHICRREPGAVLIFLPGIAQISKLHKMITQSPFFNQSYYEVFMLHSKLPSLEQNKIFERPPIGVRKIILATNIAETSITVDDVVFVIDCGKIKMIGLNVETNTSTLDVEWVAQANLRQRRGRAGRVQPGHCYHLITSWRASQLPERHLPELQRCELLEPVLQVKRLRLGDAASALANTPDAPALPSVLDAIDKLRKCGALNSKEILTPLGWHLARLPLHPSAGKLLLFGALFGCLDRAASVAAVWGFKDPFIIPLGKEKEADAMKRKLANNEPSDHVAISEALRRWETLRNKWQFCQEYFLSNNTCELLSDMKQQFASNLREMGFLPDGDLNGEWENRNADNISLFKAVVAAALYPNVAMVKWRRLKKGNNRMTIHLPEDGRRIDLHPSSVLSDGSVIRNKFHGPNVVCSREGGKWMVYKLKQQSTALYLHEVTLLFTLPLLFFCDDLGYTLVPGFPCQCYLHILNVKVKCATGTGKLLLQLRSLLDRVLASKIRGSNEEQRFAHTVLRAVIALITAEDEQLDSFDFESDSEKSDSTAGPSSVITIDSDSEQSDSNVGPSNVIENDSDSEQSDSRPQKTVKIECFSKQSNSKVGPAISIKTECDSQQSDPKVVPANEIKIEFDSEKSDPKVGPANAIKIECDSEQSDPKIGPANAIKIECEIEHADPKVGPANALKIECDSEQSDAKVEPANSIKIE